MRWKQGYESTNGRLTGKTTDAWDGRMRIKVKADVNDSTTVNGRFASSMDFKTGGGGNTTMDRIYVHHQFCDNFGVDLGRAGLTLGQTGILYDDAFDGVQATMGTKEVTLQAGYGRMKGWNGSRSIGSIESYK